MQFRYFFLLLFVFGLASCRIGSIIDGDTCAEFADSVRDSIYQECNISDIVEVDYEKALQNVKTQ